MGDVVSLPKRPKYWKSTDPDGLTTYYATSENPLDIYGLSTQDKVQEITKEEFLQG